MNNALALLRILKESAGASRQALGLRIPGFNDYFLRVVASRSDLLLPLDVQCLTELRNKYKRSFLTEFQASDERTARWLVDVVHNDDTRLLFMIENSACERVGYMGVAYINWNASYVEADAIVSNGHTPRGLMTQGLRTLLGWVQEQLALSNVAVRVLSDNTALGFYVNLGFHEFKRVPLRREERSDMVVWVEDETFENAERFLCYLSWKG